MRRYVGPVWAAILVMLAAMAVQSYAEPGAEVRAAVPEALDNFYPPKSPAPVFFIKMMEMSQSFSGIGCDAVEGDMDNARANFEQFQTKYGELAKMIPEWTGYFHAEPVKRLGEAVGSGDPGAIMMAMEEVGGSCHNCHAATMPQVQWRYHWDNIWEVMVTDPLSGQEVPFGVFKLMLESSFTGIGVDLAEGQPEQAKKQLAGFEARFAAFKGTCDACHDTERKYYVSADVDAMIAQLRGAVTAEPVDGGAVQAAMQKIGQESCSKCHRVHGPAALSKSAHQ